MKKLPLFSSRPSKMHGHMDACQRNFFKNLRYILSWEHKTGQTGTFYIFFIEFDYFFYFNFVMAILVHNFAQNYIKQNSDHTKEFTSRRSVAGGNRR